MQEMQVQSLGQEDTLEKETATHSRIFAWEIPWTEEPGTTVHRVTNELDKTYWLNNNEASLNFFYKWIVDRWISLLCSSISFFWSLISFSSTSLMVQFLSVFIEFWKSRLTQCKIDECNDIYFRQRVDHPPLYGVIFILIHLETRHL